MAVIMRTLYRSSAVVTFVEMNNRQLHCFINSCKSRQIIYERKLYTLIPSLNERFRNNGMVSFISGWTWSLKVKTKDFVDYLWPH